MEKGRPAGRPFESAGGRVGLTDPGPADVVVRTEWTGVSTGTERLLFDGRMPPFPGLGYPLVPGYETVGVVESAGCKSGGAPEGNDVRNVFRSRSQA